MQLRHRIEYAIVAAMLAICRIIPGKTVNLLFKGFAHAMYYTLRSRTRLTLKNLQIAFPEKDPKERRKLAKQSYASFADSMAFSTLMLSGRISNEQMMDMVEVQGLENIKKAASLSDKGILYFTGHIGNWELMSQYLGLISDAPLHVVARKTTNPLLEEKIVKPLRERFSVSVFYKKNALMRIMKALNKGDGAGILIDQKLNPPEGIPMEFFGKAAPTNRSAALLQVRFNVIALPIFMVKTDSGKYRMLILDPIQWSDNGKSMDEQVLELTRIHHKILEDVIRQYPEQWFWQHNKWGLKRSEQ